MATGLLPANRYYPWDVFRSVAITCQEFEKEIEKEITMAIKRLSEAMESGLPSQAKREAKFIGRLILLSLVIAVLLGLYTIITGGSL